MSGDYLITVLRARIKELEAELDGFATRIAELEADIARLAAALSEIIGLHSMGQFYSHDEVRTKVMECAAAALRDTPRAQSMASRPKVAGK